VPDVILVRKSYEEKRQRRRAKGHQRAWKLKRMAVETLADETAAAVPHKGRGADPAAAAQRDMERFMEVRNFYLGFSAPSIKRGHALRAVLCF
jgi:nonsense-mediated mRNA decay protein 3